MAVPSDVIAAVRERVSLAEIVSEVVALKRSGRNFMGLCPFHKEKSPSFFVREEEGYFHCFGCGKSGSVFDFVMETRNLSFGEALRFLANRIGLKLPESDRWSPQRNKSEGDRNRLLREVATKATQAYRDLLLHSPLGQRGREYVKARGISDDTSTRFHLGFAPAQREWIENHLRAAFPNQGKQLAPLLMQCGLLRSYSRDRLEEEGERAESEAQVIDTFRDRLIFPITRSDGCPVAFGGRIIDKEKQAPKYLNSCESGIYSKRRTFYGLSQGLPEIRHNRHVYLVEGYMDVLSLSQVGFRDVLATCGTAVTPEHVQVLKRFTSQVTVIFDGDAAGRKAAASCFPVFLNSGLPVSAVLLDDDEDPDSLAQRLRREEIEAVFSSRRTSLLPLYIEQLAATAGDDESAAGRGKIAEQLVATLARVQNPVERELLLNESAERLGVKAEGLERLLTAALNRTFLQKQQRQNVLPTTEEEQPANEPAIETPRFGQRFQDELLLAVILKPALAAQGAQLHGCVTSNALAFFEGLVRKLEDGLPTTEELVELLQAHGHPGDTLVAEAARRERIGGFIPERVFEEVPRIASQVELLALQESEKKAAAQGLPSEAVQEKLRRKREVVEARRPKQP